MFLCMSCPYIAYMATLGMIGKLRYIRMTARNVQAKLQEDDIHAVYLRKLTEGYLEQLLPSLLLEFEQRVLASLQLHGLRVVGLVRPTQAAAGCLHLTNLLGQLLGAVAQALDGGVQVIVPAFLPK